MTGQAWTPQVKANLYVLAGSDDTLWETLPVKWNPNSKGVMARDPQLKRTRQPLPEGLDDWVFETVDISESDFQSYVAPNSFDMSKLEMMPDTIGWRPLRIVSAPLRDLLEKLDPGAARFFDCTFVDIESGVETPSDYFFILPRRYLKFKPSVKRGPDKARMPNAWGSIGQQDVTWEMAHNKAFQDFSATLPYWTPSATFGDLVFRSDVYAAIAEAGMTGFIEAPLDNYLRQEPQHTIGYIRYVDAA